MAENKCPRCGGNVRTGETTCTVCGERIEQQVEQTFKTQMNVDMTMFQNKDDSSPHPQRMNSTASVEHHLSEPSMWMYVVSCFFPILQWILVGVYVADGQEDEAFRLWWKPAVVTVGIGLLGFLIFLAIA